MNLLDTIKKEDFDVFEDILNRIEQLLEGNYSSEQINELLANDKILETDFNSIENKKSNNEKEIIFYDDFSNTSSGWEIKNNNRYGLNYIDGEYEVKHKQTSSGRVIFPPISTNGLTNYCLEVDAKLTEGGGGYGFAFNYKNNQNRMTVIIQSHYKNDYKGNIIKLTKNSSNVERITTNNSYNKNESYRLKLIQRNEQVEFYIDDELIIDFELSTVYEEGARVGLKTVATNQEERQTVRFDNFKLTSFESEDNNNKDINNKDNQKKLDEEKYNTRQLRVNADYRVDLTDMKPATGEMYWVPSNKLGMPDTTLEELEELKGKPKELQEEIDVLYEALAYIQISKMKMASGNIAIYDDNKDIRWQFPSPAEYSIKENKANCVGITNVINYLLKDDYEEIGGVWYNRSFVIGDRKGGHIINYIKHNDKYYIFDALGYIYERETYSSPENGETYHKGHKHGCIHEIANNKNGEPDFKPYVDSWRHYNENMAFMVLVPMDRFPVNGSSTASHNHDTDIFISDRADLDEIIKIYDNPEDPQVLIEEKVLVGPPQEYEKYIPYNSM